jgi:hypothetical protein
MPCANSNATPLRPAAVCSHCLEKISVCHDCEVCPICNEINVRWLTAAEARKARANRAASAIYQNQQAASAAAASASAAAASGPANHPLDGDWDDDIALASAAAASSAPQAATAAAATASEAAATARPQASAARTKRSRVVELDDQRAASAAGPHSKAASAAHSADCAESRNARQKKQKAGNTLCLVTPDSSFKKFATKRKGYTLVLATADGNLLYEKMKEIGKVDNLIINTHGDTDGPLLVGGNKGDSAKSDELANGIEGCFNPGGTIFILSCHVGRSKEYIRGIANVTNCKVIAPEGYCSVGISPTGNYVKSVEKTDTPATINRLREEIKNERIRMGLDKSDDEEEQGEKTDAAEEKEDTGVTRKHHSVTLTIYNEKREVIAIDDRILPKPHEEVQVNWLQATPGSNELIVLSGNNIMRYIQQICG